MSIETSAAAARDSAPRILTDLPGPRARAFIERDQAVASPSLTRAYPLVADLNVLQFISLAGGLLEYSDAKNIKVIRMENGRQQFHKFNYADVIKEKNVGQNITLRPGDTVVVP